MAGFAGPLLDIQNLRKSFGTVTALQSVSFTVQRGEFLAVLGPSGCGKTTLLRCVAGLEEAGDGQICIDGVDFTASPAYRRPLNTVFQSLALFPHMTVFDNVAYGPRRRGENPQALRGIVHDALELVGLSGQEDRYPRQLSGGQQQRVALARAIVNKPKLLLLDEPLSALDLKLRRRMQLELKQLQKNLGISFLLVTHDQEEAMTMADRLIIMNSGLIDQVGTPQQIYARPATRFAAEFIGDANFFPEKWLRQHNALSIEKTSPVQASSVPPVLGMVRPENITLISRESVPDFPMSATVTDIMTANGISTVYLETPGLPPLVMRDIGERFANLRRGEKIEAGFSRDHLHLINEGQARQRA
jgi:spermidine/putrescine transport system ATP-binding protein